MNESVHHDDGTAASEPGPPAATTDDLLRELRAQNAYLERLLSNAKTHGYRTSLLATALSVFLGMAMFWGVAQTDWGAKHFAMPVKFFVPSDVASGLGLDESSSTPDGPEDVDNPYGTDGYCEPGTIYDDNQDLDCDLGP